MYKGRFVEAATFTVSMLIEYLKENQMTQEFKQAGQKEALIMRAMWLYSA